MCKLPAASLCSRTDCLVCHPIPRCCWSKVCQVDASSGTLHSMPMLTQGAMRMQAFAALQANAAECIALRSAWAMFAALSPSARLSCSGTAGPVTGCSCAYTSTVSAAALGSGQCQPSPLLPGQPLLQSVQTAKAKVEHVIYRSHVPYESHACCMLG